MSTNLTDPTQTAMIPFADGSSQMPTYLQQQDFHSTLDDQQTGAMVDRITQKDGGIVLDVGGMKSPPVLSIDVVILDAKPHGGDTYRAFYEGIYSDGEASAPACYSADGRVPSPHSKAPQCNTCAACPRNVKGSGPDGKSRACGFFKHVAVSTYPDLNKIYRLKVSSRSLFSEDKNGIPSPLGGLAFGLNNYANFLQRKGTPWEAVVTRISLPRGQTHGFFFTPVGFCTEEQFAKVRELQQSPAMQDVLTVEVSSSMEQVDNALPPPAPALPPVSKKDKWLADPALPKEVKDWIVAVDEEMAEAYLRTNYPQSV